MGKHAIGGMRSMMLPNQKADMRVRKKAYLRNKELAEAYRQWEWTMHRAECAYFELLDIGLSPQEARCVLPNSLKTEVVMTANLREWRTVLRLRCSKAAHPQMREVMLMLLEKLHAAIPVVFDDIYEEYGV